jgi:hypothetical protein
MKDSWCRPYTNGKGERVSGGPARESRIADQGGMDRILDRREMRGYRLGYGACAEDTSERVRAIESRLARLEKDMKRGA